MVQISEPLFISPVVEQSTESARRLLVTLFISMLHLVISLLTSSLLAVWGAAADVFGGRGVGTEGAVHRGWYWGVRKRGEDAEWLTESDVPVACLR